MRRLLILSLTACAIACASNDTDMPPLPDVGAGGEESARTLPHTASQLPALGLAGLGSLAAAWGVHRLRRRFF